MGSNQGTGTSSRKDSQQAGSFWRRQCPVGIRYPMSATNHPSVKSNPIPEVVLLIERLVEHELELVSILNGLEQWKSRT
jgi:hypothetical protein